jgi:methylated-DNA-protein-cysteine methyltransferase-like protein
MDTFKQQTIKFVKKIPKGKVASYGQVAAACGSPRAARQVGSVLRGLDTSVSEIPWWRVINNKGLISIKSNWTATKELQANLLKKDGVKVGKNFILDIEKYRFKN